MSFVSAELQLRIGWKLVKMLHTKDKEGLTDKHFCLIFMSYLNDTRGLHPWFSVDLHWKRFVGSEEKKGFMRIYHTDIRFGLTTNSIKASN